MIFWDKRIQKPELNLWTVQSKNTGTVLDLPVYQEKEEATQIILSKEVVKQHVTMEHGAPPHQHVHVMNSRGYRSTNTEHIKLGRSTITSRSQCPTIFTDNQVARLCYRSHLIAT